MSERAAPRALPRAVWALGLVSLCMDFSSELIHSLLPIFMTTVLGTSVLAIGLVEGVAEATAAVLKVFSGVISDRIGRRKPLVALGYGLATCVLPWFLMFPAFGFGLLGLRGPPELMSIRTSLMNHLFYGFGLWWSVNVLWGS